MTTVAATSSLPGRAEEVLAEALEVRVHRGPALDTEAELAEFIGAAEGVVTVLENPVTAMVLERCPELRVVANVAVGYDNVDLAAAERRGLWVTNTPDVLTDATADLTWALVLAVTRRLCEAQSFLRAGSFEGWSLDLLLGSGLQGKTIGIIGYGRIGRAVARRALAAGMRVAFTDTAAGDAVDPPAEYRPLDDLLRSCDVLSVHVPLTEETRHLLDERRLRMLPEGAFVINTSRGPVVDEAALVRVLESGHLGGVGLDVFEHEPRVHPGLLRRTDAVLLPHVGSATVETRAAMAELAARNAVAVLTGAEPPTPVIRGR